MQKRSRSVNIVFDREAFSDTRFGGRTRIDGTTPLRRASIPIDIGDLQSNTTRLIRLIPDRESYTKTGRRARPTGQLLYLSQVVAPAVEQPQCQRFRENRREVDVRRL